MKFTVRVTELGHVCALPGQEMLSPDSEDLFDEGHWMIESQYQPSKFVGATATAGKQEPTSGENGTLYEVTKRLKGVPPGKILGLDQAVHFSIDCACELELRGATGPSILYTHLPSSSHSLH